MDSEAVKPYRVKARLQNNRLWRSVTETFPQIRTQRDAAVRLGLSAQRFGALLNMRTWPCRTRRWVPAWKTYEACEPCWSVDALQVADRLGVAADWLFDPALYGRPPVRLDFEVDARRILHNLHVLGELPERVSTPEEEAEGVDLRAMITKVLGMLPRRNREVLQFRFGLDDGANHTLEEAAKAFEVSPERVRQIEARSLRLLRHPARAKFLKAAMDGRLVEPSSR